MFKKTFFAAAATALLFASSAQAGFVNLVNNGDFETNNFSGWTRFGDVRYTGTATGDLAHSGAVGAFFGNPLTGGIAQTLDTIAGATYTVRYWLRASANVGADDMFEFNWDNGVAELAFNTGAPSTFQELAFTLVANSASTDLRFSFRNNLDYFYLDDVSVTLAALPSAGPMPTDVPEPASLALVAVALAGAAGASRRKRA